MATPNRTELRAEIPALEPDGVFLDQLAVLAQSSALQGPPARTSPWTGWRIAFAATATASVIGGGAFMAAAMTGAGDHTPAPHGPVTHPGVPEPSHHQEKKDPDRLSGRSGGAGDTTGTTVHPEHQAPEAEEDVVEEDGVPGTDAVGTDPASQPTSEPADEPEDDASEDPEPAGETEDGTEDGSDDPGEDSLVEESTDEDGGNAGSEPTPQGDDDDHRSQ